MAVKTITVTEEAYDVLRRSKIEGESFTDAILRTYKKKSLREFIGILSKKQGDELAKNVSDFRKTQTIEFDARIKKIKARLDDA